MRGIPPDMSKRIDLISIVDDFDNEIGHYAPFSQSLVEQDQTLALFSSWRNQNKKFFLNQSLSTLESTRAYVAKVLSDNKRQMFMMLDGKNQVVGHFGFKILSGNCVELDNLLRTNEKIDSNFVQWAEKSLIRHIFIGLGYDEIHLRMLSNNVLARRIHESLGFRLFNTYPLVKEFSETGGISFVPRENVSDPDGFLLEFELKRENYKTTIFLADKGPR